MPIGRVHARHALRNDIRDEQPTKKLDGDTRCGGARRQGLVAAGPTPGSSGQGARQRDVSGVWGFFHGDPQGAKIRVLARRRCQEGSDGPIETF